MNQVKHLIKEDIGNAVFQLLEEKTVKEDGSPSLF